MLEGLLRIFAGLCYPVLWTLDWVTRSFFPSRKDFLLVRSTRRKLVSSRGLDSADKIFQIEGLRITGHGWKKKRHVSRLEWEDLEHPVVAFLKKEYCRKGWFGRLKPRQLVLNEARVLGTLEREGVPAPRWLAVGQTKEGNAFLLTEEIPDTVPLKTYLAEQHSRNQKKEVLRALATALARLHTLGFSHPDLYSKHILVNPETRRVYLLDWQRARRYQDLPWNLRCENLARLHATLEEHLFSTRERLAFLGSYLASTFHFSQGKCVPPMQTVLVFTIDREAARLLKKRHVREKRIAESTCQPQNWTYHEKDNLFATSSCNEGDREFLNHAIGKLTDTPNPTGAAVWEKATSQGLIKVEFHRQSTSRNLLFALMFQKPDCSPMHANAATLFRLQRHGISTSRILAVGFRKRPRPLKGSFLLTREPEGSMKLENWIAFGSATQSANEPSRAEVFQSIGKILADIHRAGCFLRNNSRLDIRLDRHNELRPFIVSATNLETPQTVPTNRTAQDCKLVKEWLLGLGVQKQDLSSFRKGYTGLSGKPGYFTSQVALTQENILASQNGTTHQATSTMSTTLASENPECTSEFTSNAIQSTRLGSRCYKHHAIEDWKIHLGDDWYQNVLEMGITDRFHAKQGRSVGRLLLEGGQGKPPLRVYLKRHYKLPLWDGFMSRLFPGKAWSPAMQEYHHLEWAKQLGILVPEPVAVLEIHGPGNKLQSALAIRELDGMLALHEAIPLAEKSLSTEAFILWKKTLIAEMARMSRILHDRNWFHKDLYLCHFYIHENHTREIPNWRNRVWMIDLHRLGHHPWTAKVWRVKDLAQLLYSSEIPGVTDRDRIEFWRCYRELGPKSRLDRLMLWVIRKKWLRYRAHNLKGKESLQIQP